MKNNKVDWRNRIVEGMSGGPTLHTVNLPEEEILISSIVTVTCIVHGTYTTTAGSFSRSCKCKHCSQAIVSKNQRKTIAERIVEFRKVHGDKYDYSLAPRHIRSNKVKIKIICTKHGVFEQRVIDHLKGTDCRYCTRNSADKAYVLCVYNGEKPIALKYGITKSPDRRLKDIQKGTNHKVIRLGIWVFDNHEKCIGSESEIKKNVSPTLTQREFNEGYTETCNINLLDYIIKTFKENGGIRWN